MTISFDIIEAVIRLCSGLQAELNNYVIEQGPRIASGSFNVKIVANEFEEKTRIASRNAIIENRPQTTIRKLVSGLSGRSHEIDVGVLARMTTEDHAFVIQCKMPDFSRLMNSLAKGKNVTTIIENDLAFGERILSDLLYDYYDARIETELFYPVRIKKAFSVLATLKFADTQAAALALIYGTIIVQPSMEAMTKCLSSICAKVRRDPRPFIDCMRKEKFLPPEEIFASLSSMKQRDGIEPLIGRARGLISSYIRPIGDLPSRNSRHDHLVNLYWDLLRAYRLNLEHSDAR